LAQALVEEFRAPVGSASALEEISLVPGTGGCYEIDVNGRRVFSKKQTGRHISDGEALALIKENV
jgi:selenoprotein W-related protein